MIVNAGNKTKISQHFLTLESWATSANTCKIFNLLESSIPAILQITFEDDDRARIFEIKTDHVLQQN